LEDVAEKKKNFKAAADKIKADKKSAELGIKKVDKSVASVAKKAVSDKKNASPTKKPKAAASGSDKEAGGLRAAGKQAAEKAGAKKKGGKAKDATPAAQAPAEAAPPDPAALEAERVRKIEEEEAERVAAREKEWQLRQEQRQEIEQEIIAEERRVREKERKKKEKTAAEKKKQTAFLEAAFDGELEAVQKQVKAWVDECFGAELIGAKIDCMDAHKHTPLSEAACGGQVEIVRLLLRHGGDANTQNEQGRTPLWRAAFMDKRDVVALLLEQGGDPRIASDSNEVPEMVAPTAEMKELLREASGTPEAVAALEAKIAARAEALSEQWIPPPPDPSDAPIGEAGYCLQLGIQRLADALDSIGRDSDRYSLIVDLGEKASLFLKYRDVNLALAYRPADVEPETLRKLILGALRFGKPFVLDMLSLETDEHSLSALLDPVMPGLLKLLLSKEILKEEHYSKLIHESDGDEYNLLAWKEKCLEYFHFVVLTKAPHPCEWCTENFFIIKVA